MITRKIKKYKLHQTSENILFCMETGTLSCFYETKVTMNDFIIQNFDFFISKLNPANEDSSSFQAS